MADDDGEKTEAATPRRRQEAREAGNVVRSPDLTAAAALLSFLVLLNWSGTRLVAALRTIVLEFLGPRSLSDLDPLALWAPVLRAVLLVAVALAPVLGGVVFVIVAVTMAQVGFNLNFERLSPNLAALNPAAGWKRVFSFGGPGPMQMAFNIAKLGLAGWVAYSAVRDRLAVILGSQALSFNQIFGLGSGVIYAIAVRLAALLFVIAALDYGYKRFRHERDLRMSKQEIKEEMRNMDGDPQIKNRRRQIAAQIHKQRLKKDVPTADVIVTNPTHFAIALQYDAGAMHAPKVVAKGADHMAKIIREIAVANGIPIIERPPLARAIYKLVDVGQEIPEQFYSAVAEILAYVYELTGKAKQKLVA